MSKRDHPVNSGSGSSSKKKKQPTKQQLLSVPSKQNNKTEFCEALSCKYIGKQILLKATDLYGRSCSKEEVDLLFQYHILSLNADCETATIHFDEKAIKQDDHKFFTWLEPTDKELTINDYALHSFKKDHEIYNTYLGRGNRIANDEKEAKHKKEQANKTNLIRDTTDLEENLDKGSTPYELLVGEFEPVGELPEHVILRGGDAGKKQKKQKWSECFTIYYYLPYLCIYMNNHSLLHC
jgi:hypothetical protein